MAMEFYEAAKTRGSNGIRVAVVSKGLTFNAAAVEAYLSDINFVRLGFDAETKQIGVFLLADDRPGSLKIVRRKNKEKRTDRAYVNGQGFFARFPAAMSLIDAPLVVIQSGPSLLLSMQKRTQKLRAIEVLPGGNFLDETQKIINPELPPTVPHTSRPVENVHDAVKYLMSGGRTQTSGSVKKERPLDPDLSAALSAALAGNDPDRVAELAKGCKMRTIWQCVGCSHHGENWKGSYPGIGHPPKCPRCQSMSFEPVSVPDRRGRHSAGHRRTTPPQS